MKNKYKPSLWWLALAPLLLVLGVGGGTTIFLKQAFRTGLSETFVVPSNKAVEVTEPGTYLLSHDYYTRFGGKIYDLEPELPQGTEISITGPDGGVELDDTTSFHTENNDKLSEGIGKCEITTPGKYEISVSGLDAPHVFTFSQAVIMRIVISTILSILLNLVGWFGAPAVVIIVLSARLKDKRRFRAENPELFDKEEPLRG